MPKPDKPTDKDAPRPGATGSPDPDDDALVYRVPELPPAEGSVTIDQRDGTFTYTPRLDEDGSD